MTAQGGFYPINKPKGFSRGKTAFKGIDKRIVVKEEGKAIFDVNVPTSLYIQLKELYIKYGQTNIGLLKHWVKYGSVRPMLTDNDWEELDKWAEKSNMDIGKFIVDMAVKGIEYNKMMNEEVFDWIMEESAKKKVRPSEFIGSILNCVYESETKKIVDKNGNKSNKSGSEGD